MIDLVKEVLPHLFKGANLVIALIALLLMAACAAWVFAAGRERKKVSRLILPGGIIVVCAGVAMAACSFLAKHHARFVKGETGVLVLQIVGDKDDSLQRDLVSSLNNELTRSGVHTNITVHTWDKAVDERPSSSGAHQRARNIGRQLNAQIVVWGDRAGERKFHPRITIVNPPAAPSLRGERQLLTGPLDRLHFSGQLLRRDIESVHAEN